jgi:hypothetical protein
MHHIIFANVVTSADRQNLPKNHPIRRLIKPFSHGTPTVNLGAQLFLTTEYGLLHRTVALEWGALHTALVSGLTQVRVTEKPMDKHKQALAELGELDFPFAADGRDLYEVMHKMVRRYFRVYYSSDQALRADTDLARFYYAIRVFKDTSLPPWDEVTVAHLSAYAASFIFHVAGMHHVVGNVAEYLMHPDFVSARIRPGSEISDVEASHYGLLVAILTGAKAPKLVNDFSHLLLQDKHIIETSKIFDDFQVLLDSSFEGGFLFCSRIVLKFEHSSQADLIALGKTIDARNMKRKWKFDGFHPSRLLSSVSI